MVQQQAIPTAFEDVDDGKTAAASESEGIGDGSVGTYHGRSLFDMADVKRILNTLPFRQLEEAVKRWVNSKN